VGGLSAAGVVGWILGNQSAQIVIAGLVAVTLAGAWVLRGRRAAASCATEPAKACATGSGAGCGCATGTNKAGNRDAANLK
jgi:hypothetical protein